MSRTAQRMAVPHLGWFSTKDGGVSLIPVRTVDEGIRQGKRLLNEHEDISHVWVNDSNKHMAWHSEAPDAEPVSTGNREPDSATYNLGHNEQMQLGICVSLMAEALREMLDPNIVALTLPREDLENLTLDTLAFFEGIFNLPGLVTLTKDSDD